MKRKKFRLLLLIYFTINQPIYGSLLFSESSMKSCPQSNETQQVLVNENKEILKNSKITAQLYHLPPNTDLKDITQDVLHNTNTKDDVKKAIINNQRRYLLFSYPSDGFKIKGFLSIPVGIKNPPLIISLRGGNQLFGLPHPRVLSIQPGYAFVTTTYRGGVSEGHDEFGGDDVNDVKNLIDYLPILEKKANITFHHDKRYLIGISRGGMQLFLALGRFPQIQQQIKKVVSLSGLLNIDFAIRDRNDFKKTLIEYYGYTEDEKGKDWLLKRQPIHYISKLNPSLPIMIIQGTADTRVCVKEAQDMLEALRNANRHVTYYEIEGGDHVLTNSDIMPTLINWLEQD